MVAMTNLFLPTLSRRTTLLLRLHVPLLWFSSQIHMTLLQGTSIPIGRVSLLSLFVILVVTGARSRIRRTPAAGGRGDDE